MLLHFPCINTTSMYMEYFGKYIQFNAIVYSSEIHIYIRQNIAQTADITVVRYTVMYKG